MRSLYGKIFLLFWLACLLIIAITFVIAPWAGLTLHLIIATLISGIICYLLSIYLTKPLRLLGLAAKSIAKGKLSTRVGHFKGHARDEIADLSIEFNRMAEQLENLMQSKERLLQDISHELRSPLTRLQIAIELGRKKSGSVACKEFMRMEVECFRLNLLIGEILDFARLERSTDFLQKTPTSILELLEKTIEDANYEFGQASARVILTTAQDYNLLVDQRLIFRALENIIRNGLTYSSPDQIVSISLNVRENRYLHIDVDDQGPGVPTEQLEIIFNPFYRVDSSREKKTGGFGLGLSIAQKAIQLHQGDIVASNRAQGGLKVRIILPL